MWSDTPKIGTSWHGADPAYTSTGGYTPGLYVGYNLRNTFGLGISNEGRIVVVSNSGSPEYMKNTVFCFDPAT